MLHIDSWEMGAQNWTAKLPRGIPAPARLRSIAVLPGLHRTHRGSLELSERFLWDVRKTGQELVIENHAERLKVLGRRYGLGLSIEPYDMNPDRGSWR